MKKILVFISIVFVCLIVIPALIVGPFSAKEPNFKDDRTSTEKPNKTPNPNSTENPKQSSSTTPNNSGTTSSPKKENEINSTIKVLDHKSKKVKEMTIDDYVKGVVLGEMPLDFEIEALKAQAVAARTYVYRRYLNNSKNDDHPDALICTDSNHCQAWEDPFVTIPAMANSNNKETVAKVKKLEDVMEATKGLIITYEGSPIDALYHSNSGGMTEDANNVWQGRKVPYLVSVKSEGESGADVFKSEYHISYDEFVEKLEEKYKNIKLNKSNIFGNIKNIKRSPSNRIVSMTCGNVNMTGKDFREIFDLRSTNIWFKDSKDDKEIIVTTYGYGHGVGLSQYGANARAEEGMSFSEIIKYYYKGVNIEKISIQ